MGVARHLARRAERQPARRRRRADGVFQALVVRADAGVDPPTLAAPIDARHRRRHRLAQPDRRGRRDPRRRAAAVHVQPDHRRDRRDRRRRRRAVLRPAHRRAHRRSTACSRRSAPRSRTLFGGVVAQAVVVTAHRRRSSAAPSPWSLDARHPARRPSPSRCTPARVVSSVAVPAGRRRHRLRLLAAPGPAHRPRLCHRERLMTTTDTTTAPVRPAGGAARRCGWPAVRKVYPMGDDEVVALDHATLTRRRGRDRRAASARRARARPRCARSPAACCSPTEGKVVVGGEDITGLHREAAVTGSASENVGFVFQAVNLVPFLTARENLLVVDELGRRTGAAARRRADQLLEELGLADRRQEPARPALRRPAPAGGHRPGADERARRWCCSTSRPRRSTPSSASR